MRFRPPRRWKRIGIGMGKLVARLVAGDERKSVAAFVPGTVVCLQQDEAGYWVISWMVHPELAARPD
jgi:hypothetical protein